MSTRPDPSDLAPGSLREAMAASDEHLGGCPVCLGGCVCSDADDVMTDEYRAYADWRDWDPTSAREFRLTTRPTEG